MTATRLAASAITALLAACFAVAALLFYARALSWRGDGWDVAGAVVWMVLAVGCAALTPRRPK